MVACVTAHSSNIDLESIAFDTTLLTFDTIEVFSRKLIFSKMCSHFSLDPPTLARRHDQLFNIYFLLFNLCRSLTFFVVAKPTISPFQRTHIE
mmetsp:Transcript_6106/g.15604  ORF Transcript_6106/g.15604 Transcript_6106/m.15604 type:complete len:93 (-) Transcript_6106:1449-1727(-)